MRHALSFVVFASILLCGAGLAGADELAAPADVAALYGPRMRDLKREVFKIVLLNTANIVLGD